MEVAGTVILYILTRFMDLGIIALLMALKVRGGARWQRQLLAAAACWPPQSAGRRSLLPAPAGNSKPRTALSPLHAAPPSPRPPRPRTDLAPLRPRAQAAARDSGGQGRRAAPHPEGGARGGGARAPAARDHHHRRQQQGELVGEQGQGRRRRREQEEEEEARCCRLVAERMHGSGHQELCLRPGRRLPPLTSPCPAPAPPQLMSGDKITRAAASSAGQRGSIRASGTGAATPRSAPHPPG